MTNRFNTFQPSALVAMEKRRLAGAVTSGTSPRDISLQLPEYGVFDWFLMACYQSPQNAIILSGRSAWFKNDGVDGSGANANTIAKTWSYGAAALAAGPGAPANDLTSLTVSDPSSSGVITASVAWASSATARAINYQFDYRMLFDRMDFRIVS